MAEGERFELSIPFRGIPVFETSALDQLCDPSSSSARDGNFASLPTKQVRSDSEYDIAKLPPLKFLNSRKRLGLGIWKVHPAQDNRGIVAV